jgi:hypothetical protein
LFDTTPFDRELYQVPCSGSGYRKENVEVVGACQTRLVKDLFEMTSEVRRQMGVGCQMGSE